MAPHAALHERIFVVIDALLGACPQERAPVVTIRLKRGNARLILTEVTTSNTTQIILKDKSKGLLVPSSGEWANLEASHYLESWGSRQWLALGLLQRGKDFTRGMVIPRYGACNNRRNVGIRTGRFVQD